MTPSVAIVTGASAGVGRAVAISLARQHWHVVLAVRSAGRGRAVLEEIDAFGGSAELCLMDLGRLDSVRDAARSILSKHNNIGLLINNAGVAGAKGVTEDGFEIHFGTNHLGHYLFTRLLLPRIVSTHQARIVNVSSGSHYVPEQLDLSDVRRAKRSITGLPEYETSKLCNVLFTAELQRRLSETGVTSVSLHPGQVRSSIWRYIPQPVRWLMTYRMLSNEEGASNVVYCALEPEVASAPALFYDKKRAVTASNAALDSESAHILWHRSAEWVGLEP